MSYDLALGTDHVFSAETGTARTSMPTSVPNGAYSTGSAVACEVSPSPVRCQIDAQCVSHRDREGVCICAHICAQFPPIEMLRIDTHTDIYSARLTGRAALHRHFSLADKSFVGFLE